MSQEPQANPQPTQYTQEQINQFSAETAARIIATEMPKFLAPVTEQLQALASRTPPAQPTQPETKATQPPQSTPEENSRIRTLEQTIKQLQEGMGSEKKAREEAEARTLKTETSAAISSEFTSFTFANPAAAADAHALISSLVTRTEDGKLVSKDSNLPLKDFIDKVLTEERPYYLAPVGRGGSGATAGVSQGGPRKPVDLDSIRPGMSKEDTSRAFAAISDLIKAGV